MELEFKSRHFTSQFESPFEDFKMVKVSGEIRTCPLSGHVTRVLPVRLKQFVRTDMETVISQSKTGCPFCPGAVETKTPRFPPDFAQEGRIRFGETVVFPNAFPYDEFNAVAVITKEHFLPLGQFSSELLTQGFTACLMYLRRAREMFPQARQGLLTWNYMPLAGAGIVHPHFHAAALSEPTAFYRVIMERQRNHDPTGERSIFQELVAKEAKEKSRYIGRIGRWHWLMAFAPRGIHEFWAVFSESADFRAIEGKDVSDLALGTSNVLKFLDTKAIQALNMSWYPVYGSEGKALRNWVSIVPRVTFPPLGISDTNYFDKLHGESITFAVPEQVALEVKNFFTP